MLKDDIGILEISNELFKDFFENKYSISGFLFIFWKVFFCFRFILVRDIRGYVNFIYM